MKNKATIKFRQASFLGLLFFVVWGIIFFSVNSTQAALLNDYNKLNGGILQHTEWNNLVNDFVKKNDGGDSLVGNYIITGTGAVDTYALDVYNTFRAQHITGVLGLSGALSAEDVSGNAIFGANQGGGDYYFPGKLSIGISELYDIPSVLTIPNNNWVSARNNAGTGYVNIFKVNANDEIEMGSALNIGNFQFAADSGFNTFVDMPVTSASPLDSVQGYVMKIDGDNILTVFSQSDGAGGIKNKRVGINTSTPQFDLDVNGTINASNLYVNGAPYIGSQWTTNGTSVYYNAGNVGIGVSNPSAKLLIQSDGSDGYDLLRFGLDGGRDWVFEQAGAGPATGLRLYSTQNKDFYLDTSSVIFRKNDGTGEVMRINPVTGNVGIGVASPSYKLHLSGGSAVEVLNVGGGLIGGLDLTPLEDDQAVPLGYLEANYTPSGTVPGGVGTGITGQTLRHDGTSWVGNSALFNDGTNVGIGTTNPTEKLHVSGALRLEPVSEPVNVGYKMYIDSADSTWKFRSFLSNSGKWSFEDWDGSAWKSRMMIRNGNVGVGTTGPSGKFHVVGSDYPLAIFERNGATTDVGYGNSRYLAVKTTNMGNGFGGGMVFSIKDDASAIEDIAKIYALRDGADNEGALTFRAGTSGNEEFMRISASGNVGIGTTAPYGKLHTVITSAYAGGANFTTSDWVTSTIGSGLSIRTGANTGNTYLSLQALTGGASTVGVLALNPVGGNVGIGTTTPVAKLDFNPDTVDRINVRGGQVAGLNSTPFNPDHAVPLGYLEANYTPSGTAPGGVGSGATGQTLRHDGTSWVANSTLFNNDTNVGIGTTNPLAKLHVNGGVGAISTGLVFGDGDTGLYESSDDNLYLNTGGTLTFIFGAGNNQTRNLIPISTNNYDLGSNTRRWKSFYTNVITDNGTNVGIGVTNPGDKLTVNGDIRAYSNLYVAGPTDSQRFIHLRYNSVSWPDYSSYIAQTGAANIAGTAGLIINTNIGNYSSNYGINFAIASSSKMFIQHTGNVGIGRTSPAYQLDFASSTVAVINVRGGQVAGLNSTPQNPDHAVPLGYLESNYAPLGSGVGSAFVQGGNSFGATAILGTNDAQRLDIETNNATRMTIASGGNVGIGTTNPTSKLSVSDGTYGIGIQPDYNTGTRIYENSGSNLTFAGYNFRVETAGTERMRIDNNGNVGIGTNSPSTNLHVAGSGRITGDLLVEQNIDVNNILVRPAVNGDYNSGDDHVMILAPADEVHNVMGSVLMTRSSGHKNTTKVDILYSTGSTYTNRDATLSVQQADYYAADFSLVIFDVGGVNYVGLRRQGPRYFITDARFVGYNTYKGALLGNWYVTPAGAINIPLTGKDSVSGNFGIGRGLPETRLDFASSTVDAINVRGGHVAGLDLTPYNPDHAVPLAYLQNNYNSSSTAFWTGSLAGNISNANSGNVGIGTTDPLSSLHIQSSDGDALTLHRNSVMDNDAVSLNFKITQNPSAINSAYIRALRNPGEGGDASLIFGTYGDGEAMRIKNGNVGIGTTNPTSVLEVKNPTIPILTLSSGLGTILAGNVVSSINTYVPDEYSGTVNRVVSSIQSIADVNYEGSQAPTSLAFLTQSSGGVPVSEKMRITSTGNVGIGTTNPIRSLDVVANADGGGLRIRRNSLSENSYAEISFSLSTTETSPPNNYIRSIRRTSVNDNDMLFHVGGNDAMMIKDSGNVGIGRTSPEHKLDFASSTVDVINVRGGQVAGLASVQYNDDHAVSKKYLHDNFLSASSTSTAGWLLTGNTFTNDNSFLGSLSNHDVSFRTNNTERMRILKGGNVGIGTINPRNKLDISGSSSIDWSMHNGDALLTVGSINSSGSLFINTPSVDSTRPAGLGIDGIYVGGPSTIQLTAYGSYSTGTLFYGNILFRTSKATDISDRMFISGNTGNVGIGTTNPGAPLQLSADLGVSGNTIFKLVNTNVTSQNSYSFQLAGNAGKELLINGGSSTHDAVRFENTLYVGMGGNTNVGIGRTSPEYKLDFASSTVAVINARGGYVAGLDLTPYNPDHAVPLAYLQNNYNSSSTAFWTGSLAGNISNANSGNVGIGTNNPLAKLQISGSGSGGPTLKLDLLSGGDVGDSLHAIEFDRPIYGTTAKIDTQYIDSKNTPIRFHTTPGGGASVLTERMRITGDGNVGIGTTNPAASLDVSTAGSSSVRLTNTENIGTTLWAGRIASKLDFYNADPSGPGVYASIQAIGSATSGQVAGGTAQYDLSFLTGGYTGGTSEKLRITDTGNVGIGTTNPLEKLDVLGNLLLSQDNSIITLNKAGAGEHVMLQNRLTSYSNTIGSRIVSTGSHGQGLILDLDTEAQSNYETFQVRYNSDDVKLLVDRHGNVGIGTTTPIRKLSVSGGTGEVVHVGGGIIAGLNSMPIAADHAVPLGYLQANYSATSTAFWSGSLGSHIWNANSGNVGIGSGSNPSARLHIYGSGAVDDNGIRISNNTTNYANSGYIEMLEHNGSWGSTAYGFKLLHDGATNKLHIQSGAIATVTDIITMNRDGGFIGIGTTSPGRRLSISGGTGEVVHVGGGQIAGLNSTPQNPDHAVPLGYLQANYSATSSSFWTGSLGGNISNANSGNVGIGVNNPMGPLHVSNVGTSLGSNRVQFTTSDFDHTTTGSILSFGFGANTGNTYSQIIASDAGGSSSANLILQPGNGSVGIGITNPGAYKLYVDGDTNIDGTLTATSIVGPVTGIIEAANVSNGDFGEYTGRGDYSFSGSNVSIGRFDPNTNLHIQSATDGYGLLVQRSSDTIGAHGGIGFITRVQSAHYRTAGAIFFENTHVGTSASLGSMHFAMKTADNIGNVALSDSKMTINRFGNVGIGTTNPTQKLLVNDGNIHINTPNTSASGNGLRLNRPGATYAGFEIATNNTVDWAIGANSQGFGIYEDGQAATTRLIIKDGGNVGIGTTDPGAYKLKVVGNVAITGTLQTQTGSDFAEEFRVSSDIPAASVVVMANDGYKSVRMSDKAYDTTVVGIVSDNPSIIAGKVDSEHKVVVAMMGVVSVKVSNVNGVIKPGDLLTTASIPGYAMKATEFKPGTVIGKALEGLKGDRGVVKVLVNLQ